MDADTQALLQEVSRLIAEGVARLSPKQGAGLQVQQAGPVVMIRPATEDVATLRVGRRGGLPPEGFYAS